MSTLDEATAQAIKEMNDQLGLYIPADVHDENLIEQYQQLFAYARSIHFRYNSVTIEEIKQLFIEFYNADDISKNQILTQLENKVQKLENDDIMNAAANSDLELERAKLIFTLLDEHQKPEYLFLLENGRAAEPGDDLSSYKQIIAQSEQEVYATMNEPQTASSIQPLSSEDVIAKYFKGNSYDSMRRNSGFTVDSLDKDDK